MLAIRHHADDGSLLVRDNAVCAFFMQAPLGEIAEGTRSAIERWLNRVPKGMLAWGTVGASATESKPLGATTISRCLSRLKSAGGKGNITSFVLQGPEEDNPAYRVEVFAQHTLERTSRGMLNSALLEFRFPAEDLADGGRDLMRFATDVAEHLPFDSGYLAPGASWSSESDLFRARRILAPLALRHPGLDVSFNASSCYQIDRRCRGPYWVTFAGAGALARLGSLQSLEGALGSTAVHRVGPGVMIIAGDVAAVGDVNRNEVPVALRTVARVLEPVTFFGDKTIETYIFGDDEEKFARWDRRLLE